MKDPRDFPKGKHVQFQSVLSTYIVCSSVVGCNNCWSNRVHPLWCSHVSLDRYTSVIRIIWLFWCAIFYLPGNQYMVAPAFGSLTILYKKIAFSFAIPTILFLGALYSVGYLICWMTMLSSKTHTLVCHLTLYFLSHFSQFTPPPL